MANKRLPKSSKITIMLGPSEVKSILENPQYRRHIRYGYRGAGSSISSKLYEAVAERFSNIKESMAEELRARDILYSMRDSDAWKTISAGFIAERQAIRNMDIELSHKENAAMEQLVQQAFDKAGITHFKASGYGLRRVDEL